MIDYYRLDFIIEPYDVDAADLLAAFLADEGFETFEELKGSSENGETVKGISAYVRNHEYSPESIESLIQGFPFPVDIKWKEEFIVGRDWNEEWEKKYFKPLVLGGGRCVVHSSFHMDFPETEIEIIVDPKMAFGTGHHETTSMMVNHLFGMDLQGKKVLDMGTGTGILAIVSKKLGALEAIGIEIDPSAYENALENISLNDVEVLLLLGDATQLYGINDVDVFLANINRNILLADMDRYIETIKPGGMIALSGFYKEDVPLLEASLHTYGMKIAKIDIAGDSNWASILAEKISCSL